MSPHKDRRAALITRFTKIFDADAPVPTAKLSMLADLVVEANPGVDRSAALHWLIHNSYGRMFAQQHKAQVMDYDRTTELTKTAKQHGLESFCKSIDTDVAVTFSEAEFTEVVTKIAKEQNTTFAKMFSAQNNLGVSLRKAHAAINSVQQVNSFLRTEPLRKARDLEQGPQVSLTPVYTGGENGNRTRSSLGRLTRDHDVGRVGTSAIDQLHKLTEQKLKERNLGTEHYSRVFAQIYSDPINAALAEQERRQNRPGGIERMAT